MSDRPDYDVAVVGASLAGCTAATLFARRGLRVALVERHTDSDAFKPLCTHLIQPGALPVLAELGVTGQLAAAGAVRTHGHEFHTRWGWVRLKTGDGAHGYNLRRRKLDPLLRQLAAATPGVELLLGQRASELVWEDGRAGGITLLDRAGQSHRLRAHLVVAADGRDSHLAGLAGVPATLRPNQRFCAFVTFQNLTLASETGAQFWIEEPDCGVALATDAGLTVLACYLSKDQLSAFQADRWDSFRRFWARLPDAPAVEAGEPVTALLGYRDRPNCLRPAAWRGLALVGDAALALDPLFAAGCGWAFQSAAWLVEATAPALQDEAELATALAAYARRHRRKLGGVRYYLACDLSRGRRLTAVERLWLRAAVLEPALGQRALALDDLGVGARLLAGPALLARALWLAATRRGPGRGRAGAGRFGVPTEGQRTENAPDH